MKFANFGGGGNAALAPQQAAVRHRTCTRCELHQKATVDCVQPRGANNPHFLLVGEAPGPDEDRQGQPFIGRSGKLLDEIIRDAKIDPRAIRWTNSVRCFPKDADGGIGKPTTAQVKTCVSAHLWLEIAQQKPGMIVALGKVASQALTGNASAIDRMRGYKHAFRFPDEFIEWAEQTMGLVLYEPIPEKTGGLPQQRFDKKTCRSIQYPVVVTYHPAAALHAKEQNRRSQIESDLTYARKSLYREARLEGVDYRYVKTPDELNAWGDYFAGLYKAGHIPWLSLDSETGGKDDRAGLRTFDPQSEMVSLQITWADKTGICIPVSHPQGGMNTLFGIAAIRAFLHRLFVELEIPVVGQNIAFDYKQIFSKFGIRLKRIAFDTRFAHQCLFAGDESNALDYIATKYCGMQGYGDGLLEEKNSLPKGQQVFNNLTLGPGYLDYACGDTDAVFRVVPILIEKLKEKELWETYQHVYLPAIIPAAEMEINGLPIDMEVYEWLKFELPKQMQELLEPIRQSPFYPYFLQEIGCPPDQIPLMVQGVAPKHVRDKFEFNPGSTPQKRKLLFDVMRLPVNEEHLTDNDDPSTDKNAMKSLYELCAGNEWHDHGKVVKACQEYSITSKLNSAYVANLPSVVHDKGEPTLDLFAPYRPPELLPWCFHPDYNLDGTATGRASASNPAIHGMPQKSAVKRIVKSRWRPQGGMHLQFDYGAMEVRVLACRAMANCPTLKDAFHRGFDAHKYVASIIFGIPMDEVTPEQRKVCKTVNFAVLYGSGPDNVAAQVGVNRAKAEKFIADYLGALPHVTRWKTAQEQFALRNGYVRSAFGRIRYLSPKVFAKGDIERRAVNTPIQSSASDVTLTSYIRIWHRLQEFGYRSLPYLFIHDSLGFDVYPGEFFNLWELIQWEMATRPPQIYDWLDVPLAVDSDAGYTWGAMAGVERLDAENWKLISHKPQACEAMAYQLRLAGHEFSYTIHEEVLDNKPAAAWYLKVNRSVGSKF